MPESPKKSKVISFFLLLLCFGFFMKLRNTANTANVTTTGGIWNVITIVLYLYWGFLFIRNKIHMRKHGMWGALFCFVAILGSICNAKAFSVSFIYNIATLPYFLIVLSLFTELTKTHGESAFNMQIYFITFLVLTLFVGWNLLGYQVSDGERYLLTDVYFPLNMLPLLLLAKKKGVKYTALFLTGFILILSGKRTGFVAMVLGLFLYYVVTAHCSSSLKEKGKTILGMIIAGLLITFLLYFLVEFFNLPFLERLETAFTEGEGGRDLIWGKIFDGLEVAPFHKLMFGHGLKNVPVYVGSKNALAHCDYLEILFDHGIVSLVFYVSFWLSMIGKVISFIKRKSPYAGVLTFALVIAMFLSAFSNFVIDATYVTYCMITFGVIFGLSERKEAMNSEPDPTE